MKRLPILLALVSTAFAQQRPRIESVSHLAVYSADMAKSERFYVHDLGAVKAADPLALDGLRFYFSPAQFVEVLPLPAGYTSVSRFVHAGFNTTEAEGMRRYLGAHGIAVPAKTEAVSDGSRFFEVRDPEGNRIQFVQPPVHAPAIAVNPLSSHLMHVGFIIGDLAREESFYVGLLGFRPYWHGGPTEDSDDWTSIQLPDSTDWLELMKQKAPLTAGVPAGMSQKVVGILDHFSLGVPNAEAAVTLLAGEGRFPDGSSDPKLGRDGKWQVNLYDPDGTRAELMEFKPVVKPCCSAFLLAGPER